jgi:hypothetical protein
MRKVILTIIVMLGLFTLLLSVEYQSSPNYGDLEYNYPLYICVDSLYAKLPSSIVDLYPSKKIPRKKDLSVSIILTFSPSLSGSGRLEYPLTATIQQSSGNVIYDEYIRDYLLTVPYIRGATNFAFINISLRSLFIQYKKYMKMGKNRMLKSKQ